MMRFVSSTPPLLLLLLLISLSVLSVVSAMHESFNFALPPAARSCFYEDFDANTPMKLVDVFVESGGSLDVVLSVHGPLTLNQVRSERYEDPFYQEKVDAVKEIGSETSTFTAELKPDKVGTFAICVDNRSAHFLSKFVQLDVRNAKRVDPVALHLGGETDKTSMDADTGNSAEHRDEEAVTRVREALERVRKGVKRIQVQQQVDRHRLQLHSATNALDNNKVVTGSVVETAFFVAAALFQIFFVRRWFQNRSVAKTGVSV